LAVVQAPDMSSQDDDVQQVNEDQIEIINEAQKHAINVNENSNASGDGASNNSIVSRTTSSSRLKISCFTRRNAINNDNSTSTNESSLKTKMNKYKEELGKIYKDA
jgi:hypothetical protein